MSHAPAPDADALRAEFDGTFARSPSPAATGVALLAIRVAASPFAVRVLDAGGLVPLRGVVPVPSRRPELLGVAGLRGDIVPVYGLARMVLAADEERPRWMILAGAEERVGFAFSGFEGHLIADPLLLTPAAGPQVARHVRELYMGTPQRPVLDLRSLLSAATARTERENP